METRQNKTVTGKASQCEYQSTCVMRHPQDLLEKGEDVSYDAYVRSLSSSPVRAGESFLASYHGHGVSDIGDQLIGVMEMVK